jgi:hypothetical protein
MPRGGLAMRWDEARRIMDRTMALGLARRQSVTVPHLGGDEKNFARGRAYAND